MSKYQVLHITTHMGGGVGKVLSGVAMYSANANSSFKHHIMLLEQPEKMNFVTKCQAAGIPLHIAKNQQEIVAAMEAADIVQVEWWHHPLMSKWLAEFPQTHVRLCLWAHIAGTYYPYIKPALLKIPQKFIFTSECSYDNPYWEQDIVTWAKKNCPVVYSSGGFDGIKPRVGYKDWKKADKFCIGYAGTQSFSKLNPKFIEYCKTVEKRISGNKLSFRMVGDNNNESVLRRQALLAGLSAEFVYTGYTADINSEFAKMDVFGYLLNEKHFGTAENVLLEAMAAGLPVVCLNQCAEKYIVQHGETGLLVRSPEEYAAAIYYLFANPEIGRCLGDNGRRYVLRQFSVKKTVEKLDEIYESLMQKGKEKFAFANVLGTKPHEIFLACLPPELRHDFCPSNAWPHILREKRKSSLEHFVNVFSKDNKLQAWWQQLKKRQI